MKDRDKKVIKLILWAVVLILTITLSVYLDSSEKSDNRDSNDIMVYDGSENNPYIEGVQ